MNRISKQLIKIAQQINSQQIEQLFNQFSKFSVKHPFKISSKKLNNGVIEIDIINDDDYDTEGIIQISITRNNKLYITAQLFSNWTYNPESFGDSGHYKFHQSSFFEEDINISSQMLFQKINNLIDKIDEWYQDSIDQYEQQYEQKQDKYYEQLYSRSQDQDYDDDYY